MAATVYLHGRRSSRNQLVLPLPSAAVMLVIHYCNIDTLEVIFVDDGKMDLTACVRMEFSVLMSLSHRFTTLLKQPQDCDLPSIRESGGLMVRSGLCSTVRHLISLAHQRDPSQQYTDLLVRKIRPYKENLCSLRVAYMEFVAAGVSQKHLFIPHPFAHVTSVGTVCQSCG